MSLKCVIYTKLCISLPGPLLTNSASLGKELLFCLFVKGYVTL